jgi:hypothetical protein
MLRLAVNNAFLFGDKDFYGSDDAILSVSLRFIGGLRFDSIIARGIRGDFSIQAASYFSRKSML